MTAAHAVWRAGWPERALTVFVLAATLPCPAAVGASADTASASTLASTLAVTRGSGVDQALLDQAAALLAAGRAADAFALLAPHESEWSGFPQFDYQLGVAALDSGRGTDAIFALERVLAAQPEFDGARMELARAQFETGDLEAARAEFSYLAGRQPPAAARDAIGRYLAAIDARAGARQQRWSAFAELGGGYDSNANGSTADRQFGVFTLDAENVRTESSYVSAAAGVGHTAGFSNGLASASNLRLDYRFNPDARFVDQGIASLNSGLYWNPGPWRTYGGVGGYYGFLDGQRHEYYLGGNVSVGRVIGESWELGAQLTGGPLRYEDATLHVLDVNRFLGALTLSRYNLLASGGRLGVSFIGGVDDASGDASPYSNHKLGGRIALDLPVSPSVSLYVDGGVLRSDYDNEPTFLLWQDRRDTQYSGYAALEFRNWPAAGWTVSPHVRYVRNNSSVSLYDHDRVETGVTLRWNFH